MGKDFAEGAVGEGGGWGEVMLRIVGGDVEDGLRADERVTFGALVGGAGATGEEGAGEFARAAAGIWLDTRGFVIGMGLGLDLRLSDDFNDPAQCIHLL